MKTEWKRYLICALFAVYCGVMLWLLFGRHVHDSGGGYAHSLSVNVNLIPFRTTADLFRNLIDPPSPGLFTHAWINLFGNIGVFIPLGIFIPLIWPGARTVGRFFLVASGVIIAIELLQYVTLRGILDVDDYLFNIVGLLAGFGLFQLTSKLFVKNNLSKCS